MATTATPNDWNVAKVQLGPGRLYSGANIPSAAARLTMHTDGSPDATLNTTIKHLGMTREGCEFMVKPTNQSYFADEFAAPIKTFVDQVEAAITGELLQILDSALAEILLPGVGTKNVGTGYEEVTLGSRALAYTSVVLIAPTLADPTKNLIFHLYQAINDAGLAGQIARKKLAGTPFAFKGYAITSRAVGDTIGNYWQQVA